MQGPKKAKKSMKTSKNLSNLESELTFFGPYILP